MAIDRIHSFQRSISLIGAVANRNNVLYIEPFGYDLDLAKGCKKGEEWNNDKKTDQFGAHWSMRVIGRKSTKNVLCTLR